MSHSKCATGAGLVLGLLFVAAAVAAGGETGHHVPTGRPTATDEDVAELAKTVRGVFGSDHQVSMVADFADHRKVTVSQFMVLAEPIFSSRSRLELLRQLVTKRAIVDPHNGYKLGSLFVFSGEAREARRLMALA